MSLHDLFTPAQVDAFIDNEILRNIVPEVSAEIRTKAATGNYTNAERAENLKLDAVCKALEWRAQLEKVCSGVRKPGDMGARV